MSFNSSDQPASLYNLVDEQGGGILVPWIKYARSTGDFSILEEYIDTAVKSFLYNGGKGKLVSVSQLVMIRNKQRNAMLSAIRRKKGRGKSGPNILDDINQENIDSADFVKALKILDGGSAGGQRTFRYRELVWDIDHRGKMGETLLHICLLHNTSDMNELAKQMVNKFPKLVNDIFISEQYYGLSPLHQAIVNEDVHMVYFFCRRGADVHQRCYGSFFCADDQKASRTDSLEHEWVDLVPTTRYSGQMYWGEYPLSFAACTNQPDAFRLLRAYRADPNAQDTNGNTVLHLTVIHGLEEMFTLAYESGALLGLRNNAKLTPLGLSARLANKKMFDLIVEFEADVVWRYGDVVCKAYPLDEIDSIREEDGSINHCSVLSNVVYGSSQDHLEFFDGLLDEILNSKWEAFGRKRLFWSLFGYLYFLFVFFVAFLSRDVVDSYDEPAEDQIETNITFFLNDLTLDVNELAYMNRHALDAPLPPQCHLWRYDKNNGKLRLCGEILTIIAVLVRTTRDIMDVQRTGARRWWNTIKSFPEKVIHKIEQVLILLMVPIRFLCAADEAMLILENFLAMSVVIMTTLHFLFYCRGLKFVGPFVLMVYKIIIGDMLRFMLIYSFFIIGFAQAFFLIFRSCEKAEVDHCEKHGIDPQENYIHKFENIMQTPIEALMRMFIMSVGEFGALYKNLNDCKTGIALQGKVFFVVYELMVTVMLLNLLIAMMTRTYEKIAETEKEWKRQWAQVILMLEQSLRPEERQLAMYSYSRPLRSDKQRRAFVVRLKEQNDSQTIQFIRKKHSVRLSQNSHLQMVGLR